MLKLQDEEPRPDRPGVAGNWLYYIGLGFGAYLAARFFGVLGLLGIGIIVGAIMLIIRKR